MKFRFASWNVNNRNLTDGHLRILREQQIHAVALQEVSAKFHTALTETDLFEWSAFSLDLRPVEAGEGRARRLGCALYGRRPFRLSKPSLVPGLDFPERALVASLKSEKASLTVCSFHTPPGATWGEVKPRTLKTIAQWLPLQLTPLVFGIDANTPKTDHPDIAQNKWWWEDEPLLLGPSPLHALKDALRLYLEDHPDELARAIAARPNGPLAVSHVRGNRRKMTDCRYDFIYISSDVRVRRVEYLFDESVKAVSDHALVVADLEVIERTGECGG
jgi:endonuclease/exonuclease/phosphatase family metal-dependent hydrolase